MIGYIVGFNTPGWALVALAVTEVPRRTDRWRRERQLAAETRLQLARPHTTYWRGRQEVIGAPASGHRSRGPEEPTGGWALTAAGTRSPFISMPTSRTVPADAQRYRVNGRFPLHRNDR
jgi:hypothetical protein